MQKLWLTAIVLLISGVAYAGGDVHWGYTGHEGPEHWGKLKPEFAVCSSGRNQSPIDLNDFIKADTAPLQMKYQVGGNEVLNNGHTVQVNFAPGSKLAIDGREFELKQYHFHAPSENLIKGKSYAMEAHLVHVDKDGNLAVVAVMFTEGKENKGLEQAWAVMPEKAGDTKALASKVSADGILPSAHEYYRFNGSLTTPPCTEGVRWFVMKEPVSASKEQIEKFAHVMHHPNNRPVQPVNARPVLQ